MNWGGKKGVILVAFFTFSLFSRPIYIRRHQRIPSFLEQTIFRKFAVRTGNDPGENSVWFFTFVEVEWRMKHA